LEINEPFERKSIIVAMKLLEETPYRYDKRYEVETRLSR
jgi:hypothetical protein